MIKKIRIKKLDTNGIVLEDRMVDQNTEFSIGPKDTHGGPLNIELVLEDVTDVDKFIDYLKKLTGSLPLPQKTEPGKRGRKPSAERVIDENFRENFILQTLEASKDQDVFINNLREADFVFIESEQLMTLVPESYEIKQIHQKKYQWMLLQTKLAKNPKADKFDPSVLVGITILPDNDRSDKMVWYKNGEYVGKLESKVPSKNPLSFMETNLIKYPHYLNYEEREKWGIEHRMLLNDPTKKPSKFYQRWSAEIEVPTELQLKPKKKNEKE